ncbi:MAG: phosphoesterase [Planctomycetaceae bacterium]|jgi:predicted NUDIX family phosphoesterase|nr:phosphoesterase [Planctomycetaceae bacterium]
MEEHVLVVPTALFHELGSFQGFCSDAAKYRDVLLAAENVQFRPRSAAEKDPAFKQLIPYMIFVHTDSTGTVRLFQYVRGKGGGESRLLAKRSIGIGGHINSEDVSARTGEQSVYWAGLQRELNEEVVLNTSFTQQCIGLINDDSTEVGSVHLGIVHRFDVAEANVVSNEKELIESGFMPLSELRQHRGQLESWSAFALDALWG